MENSADGSLVEKSCSSNRLRPLEGQGRETQGGLPRPCFPPNDGQPIPRFARQLLMLDAKLLRSRATGRRSGLAGACSWQFGRTSGVADAHHAGLESLEASERGSPVHGRQPAGRTAASRSSSPARFYGAGLVARRSYFLAISIIASSPTRSAGEARHRARILSALTPVFRIVIDRGAPAPRNRAGRFKAAWVYSAALCIRP
jgi:hypothetical protein